MTARRLRLSTKMADALRSVTAAHDARLTTRFALERRGLTRADGTLTGRGEVVRDLLAEVPRDPWGREQHLTHECRVCHQEVPAALVAWDAYDYATDTGEHIECIDCAFARKAAPVMNGAEALELLEDLARQHCWTENENEADSMALSANADALRALADAGRFIITYESGRRVVGHWPERSNTNES